MIFCSLSGLTKKGKNVKLVGAKNVENPWKVGKLQYIYFAFLLFYYTQTNLAFLHFVAKPLKLQKTTAHILKAWKWGYLMISIF